MPNMDVSEKRFEQDIETYFLNHNFRKVLASDYDKEKMLFPAILEEFVSSTQPKAWERYKKLYGDAAVEKLTRRINSVISESNVLDVLKKGIKDMGIEIKLCFFKPSSNLNQDLIKLYEGNICGITRQFAYSNKNNNTIDTILGQGHHDNQSFFAFTATPINKTLELFGTGDGENKKKPFHTYSMRQAIEEGFILDVLQNYVTIKEAFKLITNTEDNPELLEEKAKRALFKYYHQHEFTIAQKVDMIMDNFLNNGRKKINGHGKAMIVTDSRQSAVLYYKAVIDYLKKHTEITGCGVLVAFSGEVTIDGDDTKYIEAEMNEYPDGRKINSDAKFRKAFKTDDFNIMVVAEKYQTGYDEPLLHSMYVDKKLKGVNAVQTLSRLNRTAPYKTDTFVLDFANTMEEIKSSFQP